MICLKTFVCGNNIEYDLFLTVLKYCNGPLAVNNEPEDVSFSGQFVFATFLQDLRLCNSFFLFLSFPTKLKT